MSRTYNTGLDIYSVLYIKYDTFKTLDIVILHKAINGYHPETGDSQ